MEKAFYGGSHALHSSTAKLETTECEFLWLNDKNAVRRAGVQAVEACSTGQAATVQTGSACEDRYAEAEGDYFFGFLDKKFETNRAASVEVSFD